MKNWLGLAILSMLLASCAPKFQHSTQSELGRSLFDAFRTNDSTGLKQLVPSKQDVEAMIAGPDMPEEQKAVLRQEMDGMLVEFADIAVSAFLVVRSEAERDGVDWKKAKFLSATQEDCRQGDTEICDVVIHFTSAGKTWELFIDNAGKAASGWVLGFDNILWMGEVG